MLTCTYRAQAEQDALYAQGRTTPGAIVTWTKSSLHSKVDNAGKPAAEAFDVAVLQDGKPTWVTKVDVNENNLSDYEEIGRIGERLGLIWGGRFRNSKGQPRPDYPHLQL